jgi:isocitrate lyase
MHGAAEGKDVSAYDRAKLMSVDYDEPNWRPKPTSDPHLPARCGGSGGHLPPPDHAADLSHGRAVTDNLAKEYFGDAGHAGLRQGVQRKEIRQGIACVKHQNMSGSDIGDDHKEYFAGEAALKAGGKDNTMNQFVSARGFLDSAASRLGTGRAGEEGPTAVWSASVRGRISCSATTACTSKW